MRFPKFPYEKIMMHAVLKPDINKEWENVSQLCFLPVENDKTF